MIDIKSAFLQGQALDRDVVIKPPREAETDEVWCLKKCLYELKDASRKWYNIVKQTMIDLGCMVSKTDPTVFIFKENGCVSGILGTHVDDFLFGGNGNFETKIIGKMCDKFSVGKHESDDFTYTGFKLIQKKDRIVQDQIDYVSKLQVESMMVDRL